MQNEKTRILLIEDDPAEAGMIKEMLANQRRQEYSVENVQYLADALALLENRIFDCILIDLGLPDSQGLETALAVRNQAKLTPITIITILDDEELALRALEMDIQDYLVKGEITGTLLARSIQYAIQRKHISEKLRQSEERFASFMLNLPAAAWMKDLQGRHVYANAEAERIFAVPLSKLRGKTDEAIFPPETARQCVENDQCVLAEGESLQTTEVLRQADGVDHHFIVSKFAVPGPDGKTAFVAGVAFDITDRRRMEEALKGSEERFRALVTASSEVLYRMSPDWSEMRQLYSRKFLTCTESPSRTWLQKYIHPDDQSHVTAVIQEAIRTKSIFELEHRVRRADGSLGWTFSRAVPLMDANGEIVEWFGAAIDITERKRAEEEIQRLNTDLAARATELEEVNRELEAFNYTVAHDLRKPLTVTNGYCQAIKQLCSDKLDAECAGYLQAAYEGTLRMNRLLDALINFSGLARVEIHREKVDLSKIAREAAAELQIANPERRATFRIAEGITVDGDPGLLQVALDNLIGNAWKFTGAQKEEAIIEFGATEIDDRLTYFVRDNGPGFDMADAERLFIPFQRLPGAEEFKGHGIGLATVERIVRRHGGQVWAEGEPGKGATFWFTLPGKGE